MDWRVHPVNIGKGDQFEPAFLKISPNNKIPALVDPCLLYTSPSPRDS